MHMTLQNWTFTYQWKYKKSQYITIISMGKQNSAAE